MLQEQQTNQNRVRLGTLALIVGLVGFEPQAWSAPVFSVTNLVTDNQSINPAQITDGSLVNAWGIAGSGTSPFWIGDNGTGVSTLYSVNPVTNVTTKNAITVTIPGDGTVTGVVFNPGTASGAFNADNFLFVSEDGTISGWRGALGTTAQILQPGSPANVYKGVTDANVGGHVYLYAANFRTGAINVVKGDAAAPALTGNFVDPTLPGGYAPFDVKLINGTLYVTYALQDGTLHDDVAGAGHGFVSAFDLQGNFLVRVASQGTLDSPWGLAVAPTSFGSLSGDLLVGNFGDGTINAYSLVSDAYVGQLLGLNGTPLSIDGLWGLMVGGGGNEGSTQDLYFSAGPQDESHGLFGVIAAPEPATLSLFSAGLAAAVVIRRRRKQK